MVNETRTIPMEIKNDKSLKKYKLVKAGTDEIIACFERIDNPNDIPAKIVNHEVIIEPEFFGEWVDKTDEYIELERQKAEKLKEAKAAKRVSRSATNATNRDNKEEELLRAQELLNKLIGGGI